MNRVIECYEKEQVVKNLYDCIKRSTVDPLYEMEQAIVMSLYASAYDIKFADMATQLTNDDGRPNEVLKILYDQYRYGFKTQYDEERIVGSFMRDVQMGLLSNAWKKYKQTYVFDRDFSFELADTETSFTIREDAFDYLPFDSFYMDFSDNKELCDEIGVDGTLVKISPVIMEGEKGYIISSTNYLNGEYVFCFNQIAQTGMDKLTIDKFLNDFDSVEKCLSDFNVKNARKLLTLQIQSLLYLSTDFPDYLYETKASIAKKASVKRNKSGERPETVYSVGEYYGNEFRKYMEQPLVDENGKSVPTGRKMRPHVRRAHFHHYWIKNKETGQRERICKWLKPTFCGMKEEDDEKKLGRVKHKVERVDQKNKEKMSRNRNTSSKNILLPKIVNGQVKQ